MLKTVLSLTGLALASALASPPAARATAHAPPAGASLVGVTVASKVAAIAPEHAGKIVAIQVADGDRVAAGDVLFQLSSKLEELEVERLRELADSDLVHLRAHAALRHAEQEEARVKDLCLKEISSDRDLQIQALEVELARLRVQQAVLEQAQARKALAQAVERLARRTIRSPFAGVVTQRWKSEGEAVEEFVPVLEVMSLDPIWIEFDCPVALEESFRVGGQVAVAPAVRPGDTRTATILYVSMKATAASHTFMVRAALANDGLRWKAGLKVVIQPPPPAPTQVPSQPGK